MKPPRKVQRSKLLRAYVDRRHNEIAAARYMLKALKKSLPQLRGDRLRAVLAAHAIVKDAAGHDAADQDVPQWVKDSPWVSVRRSSNLPAEASIAWDLWRDRVVGFRWPGVRSGMPSKRLPPSAEEREFVKTLIRLTRQVKAAKSAKVRGRGPARIIEVYSAMRAEREAQPVTPRMVALRILGQHDGRVPPNLLRNVQRVLKSARTKL